MKKSNLVKTKLKAVIFDGHSHIERRVYEDEQQCRCVIINDYVFRISFLMKHNDISVYYDG